MDEQRRQTRRHHRKEVEFPVTLIGSYQGKARIEQGTAVDLSPGGIGIRTDARFRMEQPLSIEFVFPLESVPLKVESRICFHVDGRYGFEFLYLSAEQARLLSRVVN